MSVARVLICDDHAVVRAGIRLILDNQSEFALVGEAAGGDEAISLARQLRPDIVIMDLSLPGLSGLEAIPRVLQVVPEAKILVLTAHEEEGYFFRALQSGAMGYVLKGVSPSELLGAMHLVAHGGVAVPRSLGRRLLADYLAQNGAGGSGEEEHLTQRERDLLQLVSAGLGNKEIADKLFLSVRTVERHLATMMNKLGLHSRTQLMHYAMRRGMLGPEPPQ